MKDPQKIKLLVILGPTASGKSDLAVKLALKYNGEIISADSRQVYKTLNIGTAKITSEDMQGIQHHLIDVADPATRFTVTDWKKLAEKAIGDIHARGKLPIICGGTGFYMDALLYGLEFPEIETEPKEQEALEKKPSAELLAELTNLDPRRAAELSTQSESSNTRRLARAVLIARKLGAVPHVEKKPNPNYDAKIIGIDIPNEELKSRINARLRMNLEAGMIEEVKQLHANGLSYERLDELGLEYRYVAQHLQDKLSYRDLIPLLETRLWQYSKRQKTWFKKDVDILWISPRDTTKIQDIVEKWLK